MINQNRLKELLVYNEATGIFTNKIDRGCAKQGMTAGTKTAQGYLSVCLEGTPYLAHRLAVLYMEGTHPEVQVDHINGVRIDNRWENLRCVTRQQNMFNRKSNLNRNGKTKNVYYVKKVKRFRVKMKIDGKTTHFGYFDREEDAIAKALEVQKQLHGEYAPRAEAV